MTADVSSPETIPIRFIGVIGDGELLVIVRENSMRPYPPMLRKSIVAQLDDRFAGGVTLPDGSGRALLLRFTRKEQISVRINDARGETNKSSSSHKPANLEELNLLAPSSNSRAISEVCGCKGVEFSGCRDHGGFLHGRFRLQSYGDAMSAARVHFEHCRTADILSGKHLPPKDGGQNVPKPTADKISALRSVQKTAVGP